MVVEAKGSKTTGGQPSVAPKLRYDATNGDGSDHYCLRFISLGNSFFDAVVDVVDRAEHDVRYQRRLLLIGVLLYILNAANVIFKVVAGRQPIQMLLGLPIPLLIAWYLVRRARRVKVPPYAPTNI
jgi:hypothetical protein